MTDKGVYGFFCPHCNKEIIYDMNYYNRKIAELKAELHKINIDFTTYKASGKNDKNWYRRAVIAQHAKCKQLAELKSYRAAANECLKNEELKIFYYLLKEEIGEDKWKELHKKAEDELKAGSAINAMHNNYTQANGKNIVKV